MAADKKINSHGDLQDVNEKSQYQGKAGTKESSEVSSKTESLVPKFSDDPKRDKKAMQESGQLMPKVSKSEKAYGFEDKKRKFSPDHIQHAKEMGFKHQDDYERAAMDFWNKGQGEEYYGSKRGRFAKYNEKTGEYAVVDKDGTLKTYYKISLKKFERIKNQEGFEKWKK